MAKVYLRGKLGKVFGKEFDLDVETPKEAIQALTINTRGRFIDYIRDTYLDKKISYKMFVNNYEIKDYLDKSILNKKIGKDDVITFMPKIGGASTDIWVALIISAITTVVSALLAPNPLVDLGSGGGEENQSFLFDGNARTVRQGSPVPLGYGRMVVPGQLISLEYFYELNREGSNIVQPIPEDTDDGSIKRDREQVTTTRYGAPIT